MKDKKVPIFLLFFLSFFSKAQQYLLKENLDEVIVSSARIDIPFSKNSRSIQIISEEDIKKSGVKTIIDLLQQVPGIDIRRRGSDGIQADLYIRGGTFDQTLLLIDGVKLEDSQTGHHTLNFLPPPNLIERIEIIKGSSARIFGQNAFTGAINIVTKKDIKKNISFQLSKGSYDRTKGNILYVFSNEKNSMLINLNGNLSNGYRYNTDYKFSNYFFKGNFLKNKNPINMIAFFSDRKFGANGFYANPSATEQYEETQASLVAFSSTYNKKKWVFKPKVFWRRGQDTYEYIRGKPEIYRNLHITNKYGFSFDASYSWDKAETGFGVDLSKVSIVSNNLGDHQRTKLNIFFEHRLRLINNLLDISPGFAINYFSDFNWHFFPGLDMGLELNKNLRLYTTVGYTYRTPTYTDLYYQDPTTKGNKNLQPEEAFTKEVGVRFLKKNFSALFALYNRESKNLIDYIKESEEDLWQANNIREINSKGFDFEFFFPFNNISNLSSFKLGYSYLQNNLKNIDYSFSKYLINSSTKHQLVGTYRTKLFKTINSSTVFKFIERYNNESYSIIDLFFQYEFKKIKLDLFINNLLNIEYSETNLVPMPKRNFLFGINYSL